MIAKAESESLVLRVDDLMEERFNVFFVLLDELLLTSTFVDDQSDTEWELVVMSEEADLLGDAIFKDSEVILNETGDDAAFWIPHAEGCVDKVSFNLDNGNILAMRHKPRQK